LAKSNGRKTIPQIFINGQHIGGCDDLYALNSAGKLDALLA
jgi:glutaredoxin 3